MNKEVLIDYLKTEQKSRICVPLMPKKAIDIDDIDFSEEGYSLADIYEIRLDYLECDGHIDKMYAEADLIVYKISQKIEDKLFMLTYRTVKDGGNGICSGGDYLDLMVMLSKCPVHYIDVEFMQGPDILDCVAEALGDKETAVICSYHNFTNTPDENELYLLCSQMVEQQADIIKFALMPRTSEDVYRAFRMCALARKMTTKPVIMMSMGEMGRCTRIFGGMCGSTVTFACVGDESAPGQMSVSRTKDLLEYVNNIKISLVGFMGCGKTAVAVSLSDMLRIEHMDSDDIITHKTGMPIKDFFDKYGEDEFRLLEASTLDYIMDSKRPEVISWGGGIIKSRDNREKLKEKCYNVYLRAQPETVLSRVKFSTDRPLLRGKMNTDAIGEMIAEREPLYIDVCDSIIDVDDKSIDDIAVQIINNIISTKNS